MFQPIFCAGAVGRSLLLIAAIGTVAVGFTTVKMLPHDNKSELQIVIDAPEGFTLEQTNAAAREIAGVFRTLPDAAPAAASQRTVPSGRPRAATTHAIATGRPSAAVCRLRSAASIFSFIDAAPRTG